MNTPESWNEAYNIACQETFNVTEAIQSIAKIVTGESLSVKRIGPADEEQMFDPGAMYPSVTRGPIDVSKAMKRLSGFVPTPLEEVLRISCEWYEKEFMTNEESRAEFVDEWADNLFGEEEDLDDERADIKEDVIESVLSAFSNEL
mmetsp:Transcript_27133/g.38440  ORF Transcript_27133/g.38440 Transcript_27133/m.38440 type:complete len:146 (-) Transcript_27133:98-535(-)